MLEVFANVLKKIATIRERSIGIKKISFEFENETITYDHDEAKNFMLQFHVVMEIVKNLNIDVAVDMLDELLKK